MQTIRLTLLLVLLTLQLRADGPADNLVDKVRPVPPPGAAISDADRAELEAGLDQLAGALRGLSDAVDAEIFHKAVRYALYYNEIFNPTNEVPAAKELLRQGLERAEHLRNKQAPWNSATGLVVRAYRSKLDDSVQPYGLIVPPSWTPGKSHRYRLDVWFHGRDEKLSELNFITQRQKSYGEFVPENAIVLHTYSRYCNGQKLAGEIDLFEALADVRQHYPIDENRIVVRGFSLGGAACWHYAVHHSSLWAAAAPGAGFSETPDFLKVFQSEKLQPSWYEQKLWHMYDCTDYAANLFNLPTVAYSGEVDKQKQAADIMAVALKRENLELVHIIGPKTAHRYHPEAKTEINRRIDAIVSAGRNPVPKRVRFDTWTLRYNKMFWVTIDELHRHWEKAYVYADIDEAQNRIVIRTDNVAAFSLNFESGQCPLEGGRPIQVPINQQGVDGPPLHTDRSWNPQFRREAAKWRLAEPVPGLRKRHGLQGPIDDAFMDSFLMVRPTGTPSSSKMGAWVDKEFSHATNHWRQQFRGDARVKDDTAVSDNDIARHHLVLWGDPQSNALLAKIADKLPIRWTPEGVLVGKQSFGAQENVPVMIYPNPLNPARYVVLNSGFTFREYDYLNNARQVPKLPDYAIVDVSVPPSSRFPGKIALAGFFDENWKLQSDHGR